jgi:uncharacterized membrane protein YdbT with pleckstrin-like domain
MLSPVALKLGPGERIIFKGHPSWRSILGFYVKGTLIAALAAAIVAGATKVFGDEVDEALVILVLLVGMGFILLAGLVKRIATSYTITSRRLHIKRGIISRQIQETRLERVQNVNYHQSVFQRIVQIGDVDFDTAAGDDYNFIFTGVAQPEDVVHRVGEATRTAGAGLGDEPQTPTDSSS